jgi:hypothetical protein
MDVILRQINPIHKFHFHTLGQFYYYPLICAYNNS